MEEESKKVNPEPDKPENDIKYPIRTEGVIKYTIIETEDNEWSIEYESSTDNDIAILSIAQNVCEDIVPALSLQAQQAKTTKQKRSLNNLAHKGAAARFGLKILAIHLFPIFKAFKKSIADGTKE